MLSGALTRRGLRQQRVRRDSPATRRVGLRSGAQGTILRAATLAQIL